MALYGTHKDRGELRIQENLDELSTDFADYIAEISEISVKERGVFNFLPLLYQVPIVPSHVHSINDSVSAEQAANDYEFVIRQLVKTRVISVSKTSDCPKFDLVLLEMGPDGHVASLFPNHSILNEIPIRPSSRPERITFTIPVINSASDVAVVATGIGKAEAVHLAINDVGTDCPSLPARMIQPTKGKLVWFLDKMAASKLDDAQFSEEGQALLANYF